MIYLPLGELSTADIAYNGISNTLVCTSTGGPATTVTWRKDNDAIDIGPGFNTLQIITNTTEATYENVLQLNGTLDGIIGSYSCNVSNVKSTQVAVYTIQGKHSFLHTHIIVLPFQAYRSPAMKLLCGLESHTASPALLTWRWIR